MAGTDLSSTGSDQQGDTRTRTRLYTRRRTVVLLLLLSLAARVSSEELSERESDRSPANLLNPSDPVGSGLGGGPGSGAR